MSLRGLALVSGLYDLALGVTMLFFAPLAARLFGAPEPCPSSTPSSTESSP